MLSYRDKLQRPKTKAWKIFVGFWWGLISESWVKMMGCRCFCWKRDFDSLATEPEPFSLPAPLPKWPEGNGFATGRICLGELEVIKISKFESIWSCSLLRSRNKGASFYRPVGIPDGFFSLGHYCQRNDQPLRGFVLVARDVAASMNEADRICGSVTNLPALAKPLDYRLIWGTNDWSDDNDEEYGYFWLPEPPEGYKAMGCVVTNKAEKPVLDEVRCVRADLTETCETYGLVLDVDSKSLEFPFRVWNTRPCHRGMLAKGVSVGTFFCCNWSSGDDLNIACLKNIDSKLHAMPDLDQIHALIKSYGATVFFHPDEIYLPSSVSWFFKNGALLHRKGKQAGEVIDANGSNLPSGGTNDGEYWIDLPDDDQRKTVKHGDLESAELYVHVKPAMGGTFTDLAMWIFCPFNGPATLKIGFMNIALNKIGQHVSDWEHFTLRVSNFTGELWRVYFSQHSGGEWVDAYGLEYIEGNKPIVYSSRNGHASFPHPGNYLQGSRKLGIGVRNDAARSNFYVDSSIKYQIIAAEYLGEGIVAEPCWLQYMREWGPKIDYDAKTELEKMIHSLPILIRFSLENFFDLFPTEIYGEEGPTGPKEKNNWFGDERS